MLTTTEIQQYHETGLVIPHFRFSDAEMTRIRARLAPYLGNTPDSVPDFVPNLMECGFGLEWGRTPALLDMVGDLIGNDFVLWASGLFGKPATCGKATGWHQDGGYWPIRPLASCTVWLALDDSTSENGCLQYIPGSHRARKLWNHERQDSPDLTLNQVLSSNTSQWDEATACDVVLAAGQISIHDVFLVHGSGPNRSGRRRAGVTFRYMPTTSHYDHAYASELHRQRGLPDISMRVLYLVRGQDRCGLNRCVSVDEGSVA